jgi:hypothetical protein
MTKISIPYYSIYGRLETIAGTLVEGVDCFKGEGAAKRLIATPRPFDTM